jgi:hypothetical protein
MVCWQRNRTGTSDGLFLGDCRRRRRHRHGPMVAVMSGGVTNELDKRVAAALSVTAGSIGPLGGTAKRLKHIHKALKARRASCRLTDTQYARKASELLKILSNFDGLIAETANGTSQR